MLHKIETVKTQHRYPPLYYKRDNWIKWANYLPIPEHKKLVHFWFATLEDNTVRGFPIHFTGDRNELGTNTPPLKGTPKELCTIYEDILRRINEGSLIDPPHDGYVQHYVPLYILTKLRSISAPDKGYKHRLIWNNSSKNGGKVSLNEGVPELHRRMHMPNITPTVFDMLNKVYNENNSLFMGATDLQNGFEQLWVPTYDWPLLGIKIGKRTFVSTVGSYGSASKPKQMHTLLVILTELIEIVCLHKYNLKFNFNDYTIKYMDDTGFFYSSKEKCSKALYWFVKIAREEFGIQIRDSKVVPTTQHMNKFLGFDIVANHNEPYVQLTKDRLAKLQVKTDLILTNKFPFVTLHQWNGCMNTIAGLRWPVRAMLRVITRFIMKCREDQSISYKQIISVPHNILNHVRTCNYIIQTTGQIPISSYTLHTQLAKLKANNFDYILYTDASTPGLGGLCAQTGHWVSQNWDNKLINKHINFKEALIMCSFVESLTHILKNKVVMIRIDNKPVHDGFVAKKFKNPEIDAILFHLFTICAKFNIVLYSDWIETNHNPFADDLSRNKMHQFFTRCRLHQIDPQPLKTFSLSHINYEFFT